MLMPLVSLCFVQCAAADSSFLESDCTERTCLNSADFDGTVDVELQPAPESTVLAQQYFDVLSTSSTSYVDEDERLVLPLLSTEEETLSVLTELGEGIPSRIIYEPTAFIPSRRLVRSFETDENGVFILTKPEMNRAQLWISPLDEAERVPFSIALSNITEGTIPAPNPDALKVLRGRVLWLDEALNLPIGGDDDESSEQKDEPSSADEIEEDLYDGVRVWFERDGRRHSTKVRPNATGEFTIKVLDTLLIDGDEAFDQLVIQTPRISNVDTPDLVFRFDINLTLLDDRDDLGIFNLIEESPKETIDFRVTDARGELVMDANIVIQSHDKQQQTFRLVSDERGEASFTLPTGRYDVIAEGPNDLAFAGRTDRIEIDVGEEGFEVAIQLKERLATTLRAVSRDADGQGIPVEAEVIVVSLPEVGIKDDIAITSRFSRLTSPEGEIFIYLNEGIHRVIVLPNPVYNLSTYFTNINIEAGVEEHSIAMPEARVMKVLLENSDASASVEGTLVRVYARQTLFGEPILLGEASADAAGIAEILVPENR